VIVVTAPHKTNCYRTDRKTIQYVLYIAYWLEIQRSSIWGSQSIVNKGYNLVGRNAVWILIGRHFERAGYRHLLGRVIPSTLFQLHWRWRRQGPL